MLQEIEPLYECISPNEIQCIKPKSIDDEWKQYLLGEPDIQKNTDSELQPTASAISPKCQELHISTKTKVLFLNAVCLVVRYL